MIQAVEVFEILTPIDEVEIIAIDSKIRDIERLRKTYGSGSMEKVERRSDRQVRRRL
jgi:hypothetical protein